MIDLTKHKLAHQVKQRAGQHAKILNLFKTTE